MYPDSVEQSAHIPVIAASRNTNARTFRTTPKSAEIGLLSDKAVINCTL